ncbi:MaoC family dehydratase N-terminal domain-containing protein [Paenibacillus sp. D2_2]|uniref:FAS1-like dehydratase domain-containing protein n=1 Tax=Paenibacillus sp. D2_2 TaxID=3073092 RepID=UPI002816033C|nr:MaoC family dehydratase N-terminal domain-containing protein [Paenibacillus sp. D2_2]WMT43117.1 MaoC family dehydratase N-terminal domain-containing protein [Paenibacillus sp. D2_2]
MNKLHFKLHLSAQSIMDYANSIEAPLQKIDDMLIAPTTMPVTFWQIAKAPWLSMDESLIHGMQQFHYEAPLMAEMDLDCELALSKVETKVGRQGELTLYTHTLTCTCEGNLIVTAVTTLILVGDSV